MTNISLPIDFEVFSVEWCSYVSYVSVPEVTNSVEQRSLWEGTRYLAGQEFIAIYKTRNFITMFTTACYLSFFWAICIQCMFPSHFFRAHFNIIFPSTRTSTKWSLPFRFSQQQPVWFLLTSLYATWPANHITFSVLGPNLVTNQPIPWNRYLEKLVNKFPTFYGTSNSAIAFTTSCIVSVLSQINPIPLRPILILASKLAPNLCQIHMYTRHFQPLLFAKQTQFSKAVSSI